MMKVKTFLYFNKFLVLFFVFTAVRLTAQPLNSFYLSDYIGGYKVGFTDKAIYFYINSSKLIKCDYDGNVIWSRSVQSYQVSISEDVIYLFGNQGNLMKIDSSGNVLWSRNIVISVCNGSMGGGLKLYSNPKHIYFVDDRSLVVLDSSGNYLNSWCDVTSGYVDMIYRVFNAKDASIWIDYLLTTGNMNQCYLIHADSSGTIDTGASMPFFNISFSNNIVDLFPAPDSSNIVLIDGDDVMVRSWNRFCVSKFTKDGTMIWEKVFSSAMDTAYEIIYGGCDSSMNTYLIAQAQDNFKNYYLTLKLDSSGNVLFTREWNSIPPSIQLGIYYSTMKFHNGNIYLPIVYHNGAQNYPAIMILDSSLNEYCLISDTISVVSQIAPGIAYPIPRDCMTNTFQSSSVTLTLTAANHPQTLDLCAAAGRDDFIKGQIQVSPSPFTNKFKIMFSNTGVENAVLTICNAIGETVLLKNIVTHDMLIDLSSWPSGLYIIHLDSETKYFTSKIIKL